jgi:hypothetical protein
VRRSARRVAILLLAVVPATWGLCVTWFARPAAAETVAAAHCSCCAPLPAPPEREKAPDDCPGCGWREGGKGVLPADAVPPLPESTPRLEVVVEDVLLDRVEPARGCPEAPADGPAGAHLEGVVLID